MAANLLLEIVHIVSRADRRSFGARAQRIVYSAITRHDHITGRYFIGVTHTAWVQLNFSRARCKSFHAIHFKRIAHGTTPDSVPNKKQ